MDGFCSYHRAQKDKFQLEEEAMKLVEEGVPAKEIIKRLGIPRHLYLGWINKNDLSVSDNDFIDMIREGISLEDISHITSFNVQELKRRFAQLELEGFV